MTEVGHALPHVELRTAAGDVTELGAYLERRLVVVALRYYG
jgi:hypothetical protein